jgi:hypothetical protein
MGRLVGKIIIEAKPVLEISAHHFLETHPLQILDY